jgi:hypothetical protein
MQAHSVFLRTKPSLKSWLKSTADSMFSIAGGSVQQLVQVPVADQGYNNAGQCVIDGCDALGQ